MSKFYACLALINFVVYIAFGDLVSAALTVWCLFLAFERKDI